MSKNPETKRILPTYTAPQEILNSIQLEENNEVVEDLNKKISESFPKQKGNSKYKRDISPERIDPLQNLSKQNTQNLKQRSYKEIMLEQKKKEEREKNIRNRMIANERSKQYNNINYNSRTLNLNPSTRKEMTENNSIYTKETKWKSDVNKYEKSDDEELLSRKRKKDNYTNDINDEIEFERPLKINLKLKKQNNEDNNKIQDNNDDMSQSSSEIVEEKEEFEKKGLDGFSSSSENYDIPTPKNDSGSSSESEATLINENNIKNEEDSLYEEKDKMKIEKSIKSESKSKKDEEKNNYEEDKLLPKAKEELKYNIDYLERNRPLTDEEINTILPGAKEGY